MYQVLMSHYTQIYKSGSLMLHSKEDGFMKPAIILNARKELNQWQNVIIVVITMKILRKNWFFLLKSQILLDLFGQLLLINLLNKSSKEHHLMIYLFLMKLHLKKKQKKGCISNSSSVSWLKRNQKETSSIVL